MDVFPPTFPYNSYDFDSEEKYFQVYNSMSLALANKLKTGIKFSPSYIAAKVVIDDYSTDGYNMLYDLIKTGHPKLLRNKAAWPLKPNFQGDLNKYLNHYKNWIQYQLNCSKPHHYDDDEIADNIIFAIKKFKMERKP